MCKMIGLISGGPNLAKMEYEKMGIGKVVYLLHFNC